MIRQMETHAMLIGYARTSTTDQHAGFEAQLVELKRMAVSVCIKSKSVP